MKHMKKLLALLLCVVMVLGICPMAAFAAGSAGLDNFKKVGTYRDGAFTDVAADSWYYENVKAAFELGLMVGQGDAFGVDSDVTVAETVTLAARICSIYTGDGERFVQGTPWYQVYADYVTRKGLISLSGLDMNATATRAQFAWILSSALPNAALESINYVEENGIPDVKTGDTYADAIYRLYRAGILTGNDDQGTFAPNAGIKRTEVAAIVTRMADPDLRMSVRLGDGYVVKFDMNYADDTDQIAFVKAGETVTAPAAPARDGYSFTGWYTERFAGAKFDFGTRITADTTLYAYWTSVYPRDVRPAAPTTAPTEEPTPTTAPGPDLPGETVTVTFECNGGSAVAVQTVAVGEQAIQPDNPIKEGYVFAGWYKDTAFDIIYDFDAPVLENIALYANWIPNDEDDNSVSGSLSSVDVYSISDLIISGNVAITTVSAPENCAVVVRFIDEEIYFSEEYPSNKAFIDDGLLYAAHVVPAGSDLESIASTINGTLPEYYVAEAILIDSDGNALCDPYSMIKNTVRYKQFEEKTIYDFDDDNLVLNFDNAIDNNFGVLAADVYVITADTVQIEFVDDPADEKIIGDKIYYITSPSREITAGDKVFLSDENGNYLFRVENVSKDGDTYIIVPAKADDGVFGYELSDFYQFLKIDMDVELETETDQDSETAYLTDDEDLVLMGINIKEIKKEGSTSQSISINPITFETDHFKATAKLGGKFSANISIEWDVILFGKDYFKCDFTYSTDWNTSISITGKWGTENNEELQKKLKNLKETREIRLGKFVIPFGITGLDAFADIRLNVEWKITAGVEFQGHIKTTHGFKYNTIDGKQTIDKKETTWSIDVKGHAEISFGPKPSIGIEFLGGAVSCELGCFFGAKAEANAVIPVAQGGTSRHACHLCIDGNLKAVVTVTAQLKYKITEHFKGTPLDLTIVNFEKPIFDFYVSLVNERDSMFGGRVKAGKGSCPNKEYSTILIAKDENGENVDVAITVSVAATGNVRTNVQSGGSTYLPPANYVATAVINGLQCQKTFCISDGPKTITLSAVTGDGHIHGSVRDATTQSPIEGATIEAYEYTTLVATTKSNASGTYSFSLSEGTYKLVVTADNYTDSTQYFSIKHGEDKYLDSMLMAKNSKRDIMGGIFGTIKDATTGQPVSGVSVRISSGWGNGNVTGTYIANKSTNSAGIYDCKKWSLFGVNFGLDAGNYTVTISKEGYITTSFNVTVVGGQDMEYNSTITPVGSDDVYRIVLRWGENPSDLDSHFVGIYQGSTDHVYYSRMDGYSADLDVDDTTSYGPETVTILSQSDYSGNIYYSVHDYTNRNSTATTALSSSGATVEISKGGQLLQTFYVPSNKSGTVWNVFYLTPTGAIVPINTFEYIMSPEDVGVNKLP